MTIKKEIIWNKSGKKYQDYSLKYPQYQKTNAKIIKLAKIKPNQIIVDLACGTGMTTKEIIEKSNNKVKIYSLDFSQDMLNVAKDFIKSKNVKFLKTDAEHMDKFIPEKVDRVICNAAFWQFKNKTKVIKGIKKILKKKGIFIFNIHDQFIDLGIKKENTRRIFNEIFSEIEKRGYKRKKKLIKKTTTKDIRKLISKNNLSLAKIEYLTIKNRTLKDILDFLRIPIFSPFPSRIPKKEQEKILKIVGKRLEKGISKTSEDKWVFFIVKK